MSEEVKTLLEVISASIDKLANLNKMLFATMGTVIYVIFKINSKVDIVGNDVAHIKQHIDKEKQ